MKRQQAGFTLVEIAIVLVIIGLLLGGVLKGQEMIENGKIKSVISDMKGVSAAFYSYQDRYRSVPGDDAAATTRFASAGTTVVNGGGNGALTGAYSTIGVAPAVGQETANFWQHIRLAGFLSGDLITNNGGNSAISAAGGPVGVQDVTAAYGLAGIKVCAGSLPSKYVQSMDTQLDDASATTGAFRAGAAGVAVANAATGTAYVPGATTIHTACLKI